MFTVEQKVDLILRYIATSDKKQKTELKQAVVDALENGTRHEVNTSIAIDNATVDLLKKIGVPPHLKGHPAIIHAVRLVITDRGYIDMITKRLYPDVAKLVGSTPSRVERSIRHAIECAFDRGDAGSLYRIFGNFVNNNKGKPTNSEFIVFCANEVSLRLNGHI